MNPLTLPAELDRLLPLDGHMEAIEDLVTIQEDVDALVAEKATIDALVADAAALGGLADEKSDIDGLVAEKSDLDSLVAAAAELLATAADLYAATSGALFDDDDVANFPDAVRVGPPASAQIAFCIADAYFTNNQPGWYVHVEIPFTAAQAYRYYFRVVGFSAPSATAGSAQTIDLHYIGRTYTGISWDTVFDPTGALAPYQYFGTNGNLYLRFRPTNVRYTAIAVHQVNLNTLAPNLDPGDVTITVSASATL